MRFFADLIQDGARQAVGSRYPLYAPIDALPYLGRELKIEQGIRWSGVGLSAVWIDESIGSWRARLDAAWETWGPDADGKGGGGTRLGIQKAIKDYFGLTNVEIYSHNRDGYDAGSTTTSRRWSVVIGQPNPWSPLYAGAITGEDRIAGTTMTRTHYRALMRHLHRWRPAHVLPFEVVILQEGSTDTPADILADPALRHVVPNVAIPCGRFAGNGRCLRAGPNAIAGFYLERF
jgi:hypothetical protein